eukprot:87436_1
MLLNFTSVTTVTKTFIKMGNELKLLNKIDPPGFEALQQKKETMHKHIPQEAYEWDNKKGMHKWSKEDVKDYMKSLTYTDCTKKVIKNQINGKRMMTAKTPDELAKLIGIPIEKAEGLFEVINQQKQQEINKKLKKIKTFNPTDQEEMGMKDDNFSYDYNSYFEPSNSWRGRAIIDWTVFNLKSWFVSEFKDKVSDEQKQKVLNSMDQILLNGSKMANIDNEKTFCAILNIDKILGKKIYIVFNERVKSEADDEKQEGGKGKSSLVDKKELYRVRKLPWRQFKWIRLSKEADCLYGYCDEDNIDRAEMKCKHAIAAESMFMLIKYTIEKDREVVKIKCPVENCDEIWDWNSCLKIADMTDDEIIKYNVIKSNRMSKNKFKQCPNCNIKTIKPKTVNQFRVKCTNCNSYDWCYACQQKWKGSGLILCENDNCNAVSTVNKVLQECNMKKLSYVKDGLIPEYRACPTCLQLMVHVDACKHMKCKGRDCKTEFCFLCLAVRDPKTGWPTSCRGDTENTSWTAGFDKACKLHGRQCFK